MIYDTDTRKLYSSAGRPALMMSVTRGDALSLMIQLQPPVSGARVAFAARPEGDWTGVPGMVAYATTNPQGIAYLSPSTITDELDRALGVGSGRELPRVTLSAEVSVIHADNSRVTSHPVEVCYHNNIDRPGDLPETKTPYPPADKLVTIANVAEIVALEKKGEDGKSAYELAKAGGYSGTESQWLESLKGSAVAKGATYKPAMTKDTDTTVRVTWTNDGGLSNPAPVVLSMPPGAAGKSAYELAKAGGYSGTEAQWLASLKGDTGTPGRSAYEVAVAGGYSGSEAQWLSSLKGATGAPGKSAYEIAVDGGYSGSSAQWVASLKGAAGSPGTPGASGKSAYEIAVAGGYSGTSAQWLASLKGEPGAPGNAATLLSEANSWQQDQTLAGGKSWYFGTTQVTRKTTTINYTGATGLAVHSCPYFMIFQGSSENDHFTMISPGGQITYTTNDALSRRNIILPRDNPKFAVDQVLGTNGRDNILKWFDLPEAGGGNVMRTAHGTTGAYPAIALEEGWWELTIVGMGTTSSSRPVINNMINPAYKATRSAIDNAPANMLLVSGSSVVDNSGSTVYADAYLADDGRVTWGNASSGDRAFGVLRFSLSIIINYQGTAPFAQVEHGNAFSHWTIVARKLS